MILRDVTAADLPSDPNGHETAYRRGFHQALALAYDLVETAPTVALALKILDRAEALAGEYRSLKRHPGRPPLCDELRARLSRRRKPAPSRN